MKIFPLMACLALSFIAVIASQANAGPLRERLKERIEQKRENIEDKHHLIAGDHTFTLDFQGEQRRYQLHIPENYQSNQATPMVISLHGGGGNMRYQATDEYYGWISKSEQAGFIAVFPNGYSRFRDGKLATWNAGICCGQARDNNVDDVGYIQAVIADIQAKLNIDSKRIYANGMSNGGMMAYRLACELPEIRAIASVTGTDGTLTCRPTRAVPILHIHAKDDDRVLFNGGSGSASDTHADFVSVPKTIEKWVKLNRCQIPAKRVLQVEGAYCEEYSGCREDVKVKLCVTETGGHSWPGGKKVRGKTRGSEAINATDLIWAFYNQ
jgi:polyhydroxybutyrate depolymerase